ncbi:hypothetical protein C8F01DRAFT_922407, partial [Mycena amicta]
ARRLKSGDISILLRCTQDAEFARSNAPEWIPAFAPGAVVHQITHPIVVNGIPATFDPATEDALRQLEQENEDIVLPYSIVRGRWLRRPHSSHGSLILELRDQRSANQAI